MEMKYLNEINGYWLSEKINILSATFEKINAKFFLKSASFFQLVSVFWETDFYRFTKQDRKMLIEFCFKKEVMSIS